jgi:3-oxoacyl-[acyl-carrier protein] reductase
MGAGDSNGRFSLEGRVAFVTGSSTGLGKAMAMSLGASGAKVAMNYANNQERGERAFEEFKAAGYDGILVRASVIEPSEVNDAVAQIEKDLGPVDILVPNATSDQPHKPIEEYDWDFYQEMLDFFVKSPYLLVRATLASMKKQRWGRIINIGSEVFQVGVPNFTAYVAAKGAQTGFNRSLANELAPWNITVNIVSPGWIPVERHEKDPQEEKDAYLAGLPMKRWGTPEEVGELVAFLASDGASYISGQNIAVNGSHTVA